MTPDEVLEIITLLREAADTLAHVRADLNDLQIVGQMVTPKNGRLKVSITKGVLSAEAALREALEPVDWIE